MNGTAETPRRRRFRFSLRSFFIVLTLFAIWLGWNVHQVRQRKRMEQYVQSIVNRNPVIIYGEPAKPWKSLPIMWRLLGVRPAQAVILQNGYVPDDDKEYIRQWFPEADVTF